MTVPSETAVRLYCASRGYPEPVAEFAFHPVRKWKFDFAWPDRMVALEFEGLTHDGGRHQRKAGFTADCSKYNAATLAGWKLIRVTHKQVRSGEVFPMLDKAFGV